MFGPGGTPRAVGHRGAAGVAPENTLPAIRHAVAAGAHAIEVDVHRSADGRLVVVHDATVDRTTDGTGAVSGFTLAELRAFDAGFRFTPDRGRSFPFRGEGIRIPTLEEAFAAAGELPMVVEVKSIAAGEALADWLRERPERERTLVGGFDSRAVIPAARHARWRCASEDELRGWVLATRARLGRIGFGIGPELPRGVAALMLPERRRGLRVVTRGLVRRAHGAGAGVFVWTVNRPRAMRRLLHMGVDGVISDFPGIARRVVDEVAAEAREGAPADEEPGARAAEAV